MDTVTLLTAVAGVLAVLASIGVLLTRDNFYAALYMSVAMIFIAAIYAVFNLQPVVVMITLVFVGAVGIVTIAIAATYRAVPTRKVDLIWIAPVIVVFAIVSYAYFSFATANLEISAENAFADVPTDYLFVVLFLFAVMILMMLSAIKLARRVET